MRDPKERLRDILDAIAAIERYRDPVPALRPVVERLLKCLEERESPGQ